VIETQSSISPAPIHARPRKIVRRTRGSHHGPITRLMSPSDLGQVLKPFVFLDLFDLKGASSGIGLHPHSGIATVSYLFEGSVRYEDSTGATGVLLAGGVEWFKAGHGAWHGGGPGDTGRARGFQLWLALPSAQELGQVENVYLAPDAVARDGPARVLVGTYGGATSSLNAPTSLNYLAVRLRAGESWRYQPAVDHTVGWVSLSTGRVRVPESVEAGELAIFEHGHDLVLGPYSVHTSPATLRAGERRLSEIQHRLQREGRL
jgi:redox-sensitive bicupin YhaK (pirin superfamily)